MKEAILHFEISHAFQRSPDNTRDIVTYDKAVFIRRGKCELYSEHKYSIKVGTVCSYILTL